MQRAMAYIDKGDEILGNLCYEIDDCGPLDCNLRVGVSKGGE